MREKRDRVVPNQLRLSYLTYVEFKKCISSVHIVMRLRFKEWSKENVKTRTTRSRTREGKRLGRTSSLERLKHLRHSRSIG
ncbi:hypothetical protein T01_6237 [Trichinella spiralis]|uniref:Uncharacterized protein n=1 Tax=Trichinella spiralis TaxID=6334 RepID=A0A0V1B5H3_TRISP|nr:hypothetical protein T01_6237 [Trichinella spiralis]